jgi:hypothetical protein
VTDVDLARLDRVELLHAGTWHLALGGEQTFTGSDLAAAVTALDCPAVARPIVKLGHFDERTSGYQHVGANRDGEPALGWIANLGLTTSGTTLVGDLVGMPAWLGKIAASAYPHRSVEGSRNYRCAIGHLHPFVLSAVALLGVTPPAVGTLGSLQDHVRALYGVAAAAADQQTATGGEGFIVTTTAEEAPVSTNSPAPPRATLLAAAATVDELRAAFYQNAPYDMWIVEIQLSPLQLIVRSDNDATYRVPVTVGADNDSFAFGAMVPVEVTYVDEGAEPVAAADGSVTGGRPLAIRFSSRAESRPGEGGSGGNVAAAEGDAMPASIPQTDPRQDPVAPPSPATPVQPGATPGTAPAADPQPETPAHPDAQPEPSRGTADPAAEPDPSTTTEEGDDMSLSEVASRLGLGDDADKDAVLAKLDEVLKTPAPDPVAVAASAEAATKREKEFAAALDQIKGLSGELAQIKAEKAQAAKDAFFAAALRDGKILPAEREALEADYDKAPDVVTRIIGATAPGAKVPVAAAGYTADPEPGVTDDDLLRLLPPDMAASVKGN